MYLIEILHQTTTAHSSRARTLLLYLIEILHQTTTKTFATRLSNRCILSKFYIKPQRCGRRRLSCRVVSYRNSTSNHNRMTRFWVNLMLYLIEILHQTTTVFLRLAGVLVLYLIEILHQTTTVLTLLWLAVLLYLIEILHQTTTGQSAASTGTTLYLIEILHQTTTSRTDITRRPRLYLIEILHQTTTSHLILLLSRSCILSKFYIKPQPRCWFNP